MRKAFMLLLVTAILPVSVLHCGGVASTEKTAEEFTRRLFLMDFQGAEELVGGQSLPYYREMVEEQEEQLCESEEGGALGHLAEIGHEKEKEEALANLAKMKFTAGTVTENTAIVYVTHEDFPGQPLTVALVRENGEWKVDLEKSSLFTQSRSSAQGKTCMAQMRTVLTMANVFAAANNGRYPMSWEEMEGEYLEEIPLCPLYGSKYNVEWHADAPPEIECPNHGSPASNGTWR